MAKIRITENDLRDIIRESVVRELNEYGLGNLAYDAFQAVNPFEMGRRAYLGGKALWNAGKSAYNTYQRGQNFGNLVSNVGTNISKISSSLDGLINQANQCLGVSNQNRTTSPQNKPVGAVTANGVAKKGPMEEAYTVKTTTDATGVGTRTTTDANGNTKTENLNPYDVSEIIQKINTLQGLIQQLGQYKANFDALDQIIQSKGNIKTAKWKVTKWKNDSIAYGKIQNQNPQQNATQTQQQNTTQTYSA